MENLNLSPKTKEMIERYEKRCPVCGSLDCMRHSEIAREFLRKKEESPIFQTIPLMEAFINKKETKEMTEKILNNAFEYFKYDAEKGQRGENITNAAWAFWILAAFRNSQTYDKLSSEQKNEAAQLITKELLNNVFENFKYNAEKGQEEGETVNAAVSLWILAAFHNSKTYNKLSSEQKKEISQLITKKLLNNAFEYFKNDAEQGQKEGDAANAAYALRALAAFHNPKIYEGVSPEQKKEIAQLITKELLNNVFENFKRNADIGQRNRANAALALWTLAGFHSLIPILKEQQKKEESAKRDEELLAKVPTPEIRRYPPTPKKIL